MPTCPKCGGFVKRDEYRCPHCAFKADFARLAKEEEVRRKARAGLISPEEQAAFERESQLRKKAVSMPIVTLQHVPGREIERVVGVVTAEVVLGTGLFTDLSMALSDMIGTRATEFEAKWREAKEDALYELKMNAHDKGCNAVVGVDVELATVDGIAIIIVVGTGVVLAKENAESDT